MSLEGEAFHGWDKTSQALDTFSEETRFENLVKTVDNFHRDTGCAHGDCHLGNVVPSLINPFVLIDLERTVKIDDLRMGLEGNNTLLFVDKMHLFRHFFHGEVAIFMETSSTSFSLSSTLISKHMTIFKFVCEYVVKPYAENSSTNRTLKQKCKELIEGYKNATGFFSHEFIDHAAYLNKFKTLHGNVESILTGKWFSCNNIKCGFLEIIGRYHEYNA